MPKVSFLGMLMLSFVAFSGCVQAQHPADQQGTDQQGTTTPISEEGLSQKMDKAIKILTVVKDELQDAEKKSEEAAKTSQGAPAEAVWKEDVKQKADIAIKMGTKISNIVNPEEKAQTEKTAQELSKTTEKSVDKIADAGGKIQKIVAEYTTKESALVAAGKGDTWTESAKNKLDAAIKVLDTIKTALEDENTTAKAGAKSVSK